MNDVEQAKAHFFAALDLLDAKDFAAAETALRAALAIVPDRISALTNLAVALFEQDKLDDAVAIARRATELAPEDCEGWLALGASLGKLGDGDGALAALNHAVTAAPDNPRTLIGRAAVHTQAKRPDLAVADYRAARRLGGTDELDGRLLASLAQACDWTGIDALTAACVAGVRDGSLRIEPFTLLSKAGTTAADHLACARAEIARDYPPMPAIYRGERYGGDRRIRVAYVSADYHQHPTSQLMAGIFERHDRSRFEIFGVSFGPDDGTAMRARVSAAFEHFADVRGQSDSAIAAYIRANEVDVAIDLGGFTTGGRLRVFAQRPAPVQAAYLGYPGTSGAPYIDYLIADHVIIPQGDEPLYSEAIVRLPDSYQANDSTRYIAPTTASRAEAGLPKNGFVYCSFNNNYKITPPVFDIWMTILKAVPGSVLWLIASNATASENLRREAARRGIAPERIVFAPPIPADEHLGRHRLADLVLDTSPYNAHTTAADALWTGLPIVTCPGTTFASRVAASLLEAIGVPELIAASFDEYRALAIELAQDPSRLAAIKAKLAANRNATPLFDTARTTRHLEAAYTTMVERQRRGEKPAAFAVAPVS